MHREMIETMTTDALLDLYAGIVTPMDREILKDMPLPEDMVDPFASQDVEPLALMNLNYVSLSGWIAEARKEKYSRYCMGTFPHSESRRIEKN